jgi:hypothetical protein
MIAGPESGSEEAISCNAKAIIQVVQKTFKLKNDRIEAPEFYLGAKL